MSAVQAVTDDTFEEKVLKAEGPVVVDFWATWCGPCLQIAPVLEDIARDHADKLTIVKLDVDANPVTAAAYRITGMPTLNVFVRGEVAAQVRGAKPRAALLRDLEPFLAPHEDAVGD